MMKINRLIVALIFCCMQVFAAQALDFDELSFENAQENGPLWLMQGQPVQVRGFWYPLSANEGILAPHAQLKSCCLQASAKIEQQLLVKGKQLAQLPSQRVVTLKGIFKIEPVHNPKGEIVQLFVLEEAQEIPQANWHISGMLIGGIFLLLAFKVFKSLKRNLRN